MCEQCGKLLLPLQSWLLRLQRDRGQRVLQRPERVHDHAQHLWQLHHLLKYLRFAYNYLFFTLDKICLTKLLRNQRVRSLENPTSEHKPQSPVIFLFPGLPEPPEAGVFEWSRSRFLFGSGNPAFFRDFFLLLAVSFR